MEKAVLSAKTILFYFTLFSFIFLTNSCSTDDMSGGGEPIGQNDIPTLEENLILDKSGQFLNYVIPQEDYDKFLDDKGEYSLVTHKVYEYFKDDFDFIFIFADEDVKPDGVSFGKNRSVKLDIEGLGRNFYDNTASYGSDGRLKSIIYMPLVRYIQNGPFLHEIAHHWANKDFIPTTVSGHWGYSNVGGQLGGFDELKDLGNGKYLGKLNGNEGFGTFANSGNKIQYGNAELYLMGLIPESDLESIQVAENPENADGSGVFTASKIRTYTPEYLINQHGSRIPSFDDSQKKFKAISVIISTSPITVERKEMTNSNLENFVKQGEPAAEWGYLHNFWKATGGVGAFEVNINSENLK